MKKGILTFSILLGTFFLYKDLLFVVKPYKEPSLSSFLKNKKLKDSLSYELTTAKITFINEIYGLKTQPNKVTLGIKYFNTEKSCWIENMIDAPYLFLIGTLKKEGQNINIVYSKNIDCNVRKNAIYIPSKEDINEIKLIKWIKISLLSIFVGFLTWNVFLKKKIKSKNSTITYYK